MIISLPFFYSLIPYPLFVSIAAILVVGFFAAVLTPGQQWATLLDVVLAGGAFAIFEYYAADAYIKDHVAFFIVNQVLAANFFTAFYYAVKTMRGSLTGRRGTEGGVEKNDR